MLGTSERSGAGSPWGQQPWPVPTTSVVGNEKKSEIISFDRGENEERERKLSDETSSTAFGLISSVSLQKGGSARRSWPRALAGSQSPSWCPRVPARCHQDTAGAIQALVVPPAPLGPQPHHAEQEPPCRCGSFQNTPNPAAPRYLSSPQKKKGGKKKKAGPALTCWHNEQK